jgi:iron-sulfur cluster assembly protein
MEFIIDDSAKQWLSTLHAENPNKNKILLINLIKSGCSGWAYHYSWLENAEEFKGKLYLIPIEYAGKHFEVAFPEMYLEYLNGSTLKFVTVELNSRLIVDNPNVSTLCGCGESVNFEK